MGPVATLASVQGGFGCRVVLDGGPHARLGLVEGEGALGPRAHGAWPQLEPGEGRPGRRAPGRAWGAERLPLAPRVRSPSSLV